MTIILVMDNDFAIGKNGGLLYSLPEDMKRFREITQNSAVIMGRRTYESFPKRPLPNRENLVLSRSAENIEGARVFPNVESVLEYVKDSPNKVFVIGGGDVYRQLLPYCGEALITRVYDSFGGDVFFYDIENDPEWELVEKSEEIETNGKIIRFLKFIRRK